MSPPKVEDLRAAAEQFISGLGPDAERWRRAVAVVWTQPWGPQAEDLAGRAAREGRPELAAAFGVLVAALRERAEEDERHTVAQEIQRLVASSGLSQREFAALIGTSPSRLSTYVRGSVTPSAAMMLRIRRVSRREALSRRRDPTPRGRRT